MEAGMGNPAGASDDRQSRDGLLGRFKAAVSSTRRHLVARMEEVLQGRKTIDPELLEEIEEILVGADVGINTTTVVLDRVRDRVERNRIDDVGKLKSCIRSELLDILQAGSTREEDPASSGLQVLLVVGVNGVGKTTTAGKLAGLWVREGRKVLVCAADTFRAAAVERRSPRPPGFRQPHDRPSPPTPRPHHCPRRCQPRFWRIR